MHFWLLKQPKYDVRCTPVAEILPTFVMLRSYVMEMFRKLSEISNAKAASPVLLVAIESPFSDDGRAFRYPITLKVISKSTSPSVCSSGQCFLKILEGRCVL